MSKPDERDLKITGILIDELYDLRRACLRTVLIAPCAWLVLCLFCVAIAESQHDPILVVCVITFWITIIIVLYTIVRIISIDQSIWMAQRFQAQSSEAQRSAEIEEESVPDDLPPVDPS